MFAWIATLTRRGAVLRALAAAGVIGAAACDTDGPVGPTLDRDGQATDSAQVSQADTTVGPMIGFDLRVTESETATQAARSAGAQGATTAALCLAQPEEGDWRNIDAATNSLTRIKVRALCQDQVLNGQPYPQGSPWYVHVFAKCSPTDCDWGEVGAVRLSNAYWSNGYIYAFYDQGFAKRYVFVKLVGSYLLVYTWTDFVDPSRPDYWSTNWFQVPAYPDLIVESLTHAPVSPTTADWITFTAVVKNVGSGTAGASTLEFRIGGETPGTPQTRIAVPALGPGQTLTVNRYAQLSVAQNYCNTAGADVAQAVAESNEWNNVRTDCYPVTAPAHADLIVESLTHAPVNPTTADWITFTAVVKNVGSGTAGASTLEFRIGGETPGTPQTEIAVPALGPGQTHTVNRYAQLSVAQNYRNTATADVWNVVAESNEMNNARTDDYTVRPPAPCTQCESYAGVFNWEHETHWIPQGNPGFYYSGAGTHRGWLRGPAFPVDFDLFLERWNGSAWVEVANSRSTSSNEQITYYGAAGYYRWKVYAYNGSGGYLFWLARP